MSEQLEQDFNKIIQQGENFVNLPEPKMIEDAEWCFQFFNNEPVVFGYQSQGADASPLVLQIQPKEGEVLNFRQNGMEFKIFPRPISEETKIEREKDNVREVKEA